MIPYACIKIDVTMEYLNRVRKGLTVTVSRLREASKNIETGNLESMIEFINRSIALLNVLKKSLCGEGSIAVVANTLDTLYVHVATSRDPVPSQVKAALLDLYMSLKHVIEGQRPKASSYGGR